MGNESRNRCQNHIHLFLRKTCKRRHRFLYEGESLRRIRTLSLAVVALTYAIAYLRLFYPRSTAAEGSALESRVVYVSEITTAPLIFSGRMGFAANEFCFATR